MNSSQKTRDTRNFKWYCGLDECGGRIPQLFRSTPAPRSLARSENRVRTLITSAAVIFGLLGAGAAPALAAKGVKKNPVNGVHHVHGVVTHVQHHKAKNSAGHVAEITVKTHHHKKKGQPASTGKKVTGHTHKYSVGTNTKVTHVNNKQHTPATVAAIHAGEHVSLNTKGTHAEAVAIHHHTKKKK